MAGLQVLNSSSFVPWGEAPQHHTVKPISLPGLSVLGLSTPFRLEQSDYLPSVRELYLYSTSEGPRLTEPFIAQITSVTLHGRAGPAGLEFIQAFPNLKQLVIWYGDWSEFHLFVPLLNIDYLKLGRRRFQDCYCGDNDYMRVLRSPAALHAPKLRVLQFLGYEDERAQVRTERPKIWAHFRELAQRVTFEIQNTFGEVISD
ncbi:hypothetical protein GLOTRDRAFT_125065 [Gloeophyllum trabeum ATCC 11539]|uniref:F-box domain-containing protein n=1 Tax=Gloeophyllum trabeum (strain ATCC 11539 / FP-39264 / Madison 617) TaxID=670483 RepID=S7S5Q7_GLOTA|nr:uncharacterized protein GLOTRDRAFT_125065 [Gloeophyllum trabeum ATCC 11539]EPQ61344.1 hypothetical protein GLOTRDRAFT_125065 [Gloeophyllum trabeum ATCC 11539]